MIKIINEEKEYLIKKDKLKLVLSKLEERIVNDDEINDLFEKYKLNDEVFLQNVNNL